MSRETFAARARPGAEPVVGLAPGAQNLPDARIQPSNPADDFFGNFAFDVLHPVGINGRDVYARASLRF